MYLLMSVFIFILSEWQLMASCFTFHFDTSHLGPGVAASASSL